MKTSQFEAGSVNGAHSSEKIQAACKAAQESFASLCA